MRFQDKRVAVTGAAGNLGQAVVKAFLDEGAVLTLIDRVPASIECTDPTRVRARQVDLTDAEACLTAFEQIGAVDVLCNVAGGFDIGTPIQASGSTRPTWRR